MKCKFFFFLVNVCLFGFSLISTQKNVLEDQHVLFSSSQTQEGAEEASVLVIDKIIQISEVTHEKTGTDNLTNEDELDCLLNPVAELQQNFLPGRGINGHANSSPVQNSVFPCGPKAPEKLQEVHNDGQVSWQYQVMVVLSNPGYIRLYYGIFSLLIISVSCSLISFSRVIATIFSSQLVDCKQYCWLAGYNIVLFCHFRFVSAPLFSC